MLNKKTACVHLRVWCRSGLGCKSPRDRENCLKTGCREDSRLRRDKCRGQRWCPRRSCSTNRRGTACMPCRVWRRQPPRRRSRWGIHDGCAPQCTSRQARSGPRQAKMRCTAARCRESPRHTAGRRRQRRGSRTRSDKGSVPSLCNTSQPCMRCRPRPPGRCSGPSESALSRAVDEPYHKEKRAHKREKKHSATHQLVDINYSESTRTRKQTHRAGNGIKVQRSTEGAGGAWQAGGQPAGGVVAGGARRDGGLGGAWALRAGWALCALRLSSSRERASLQRG
jgi:hypothetical protein